VHKARNSLVKAGPQGPAFFASNPTVLSATFRRNLPNLFPENGVKMQATPVLFIAGTL